MLSRIGLPLIWALWFYSIVCSSANSNYFLLESPNGCIGRRRDGSDELFLKECDPEDDHVLWRRDTQRLNRFHSYTDDSECIQVETNIDAGTDALRRGSRLYKKPCAPANSAAEGFQAFDPFWEEGGPLTLMNRPDLCAVHFGADPSVGESRIMMVPCDQLRGDRALGWFSIPVEFEYVVLDSLPGIQRGGCIGRNKDGSDELIYKACLSNDDTIQWRLDNQGRLRSKIDDRECIQAEERPELLKGVENLKRGSRMYVKTCANPENLKEDFQVLDESWADNGFMGPLSLQARPDLCVVHFGAEPVVGESRIMLVECVTLGGSRAEGWEATDPCAAPPVCNFRFFNSTAVEGNATTISVPTDAPTMAATATPTLGPTNLPTVAPTTAAPTLRAPISSAPITADPTTVAPTTEGGDDPDAEATVDSVSNTVADVICTRLRLCHR